VEISAVFKNKKSFFAKKVSRETAKAQNSGQNRVNRKIAIYTASRQQFELFIVACSRQLE
jgi:hypothetical protein